MAKKTKIQKMDTDVKSKVKKTAKKKVEKQQNLENILFECRNKLRCNTKITTKRDMLLVFLRFICSRFNEHKERIAADVLSQIARPCQN